MPTYRPRNVDTRGVADHGAGDAWLCNVMVDGDCKSRAESGGKTKSVCEGVDTTESVNFEGKGTLLAELMLLLRLDEGRAFQGVRLASEGRALTARDNGAGRLKGTFRPPRCNGGREDVGGALGWSGGGASELGMAVVWVEPNGEEGTGGRTAITGGGRMRRF